VPLERAKLIIEVVAGIIPGESMPEYTKGWGITSTEWDIAGFGPFDVGENAPSSSASAPSKPLSTRALQNPNRVNWVRVDWIWV
jgi:hypothetical protein